MLFNPFQLKSTLARNVSTNQGDALNAKKVLNSLGYYKPSTGAINNKPDNNLFKGIKSFQSAFGLKRDGVMKPGGETERALGQLLEKKRNSTAKPSSSLVVRPEPNQKPSLLDQLPQTTPGIMPGEHYWTKRKTPDIAWSELQRQSTKQIRDIKNLLDMIARKARDNGVVADGARTVKAALKTSDHTGLAKFHATAVKDFGDNALAEIVEFGNQLKKANPKTHKSWLRAFTEERPDDAERMELAGKLGENSLKGGAKDDTLNAKKLGGLSEETVGAPLRKPEPPKSESLMNESDTAEGYKSPVHRDFRDSLHKLESATDGYKSFNPEAGGIGALGRYQMRRLALIDAGMINREGNWTGKYGVKNAEDFLNSPEAQERAFTDYMARTEDYLRVNDSYDVVGQTFPGKIMKGVKVTEAGLLAAAHRMGHKNVKKYLEFQKRNEWSSDFSKAPDVKMIPVYEAIETRIRLFQNKHY